MRSLFHPMACSAVALAATCIGAQPRWDLSGLPPYKPGQSVSGTIRNFGGPLAGMVQLWEAGFMKVQPDIRFKDNFKTGGEGALAGLYTGVADLGPSGDPAKQSDEMPFEDTFHYPSLEIEVGTGAYDVPSRSWTFVVVVNRENPISKLSFRQLDGIFGSERNGGWKGQVWTPEYARGPEKDIRTWGQLGLTGDWADKPINTYGYASQSWTYVFQQRVLKNTDKWNPNYHQYVEAKQTIPGQAGEAVTSQHMLAELSKDKYGIGWTAVQPARNFPQTKALALADQDSGPYVECTIENLQNRTYPFTRSIYIYLNRAPGKPVEPKLKEFLRYVLSREGQEAIVQHGDYLPLTAEAAREQLEKLD